VHSLKNQRSAGGGHRNLFWKKGGTKPSIVHKGMEIRDCRDKRGASKEPRGEKTVRGILASRNQARDSKEKVRSVKGN